MNKSNIVRKSINVDKATWYELKLEAFQRELSLGDYLGVIFQNRKVSELLTSAQISAEKEHAAEIDSPPKPKTWGTPRYEEPILTKKREDEIDKEIALEKIKAMVPAELERIEKKESEILAKGQAELDRKRVDRNIKKEKIEKVKAVFNPQPKGKK